MFWPTDTEHFACGLEVNLMDENYKTEQWFVPHVALDVSYDPQASFTKVKTKAIPVLLYGTHRPTVDPI